MLGNEVVDCMDLTQMGSDRLIDSACNVNGIRKSMTPEERAPVDDVPERRCTMESAL